MYDADVLGDSALKAIATEHCIIYTVRLLDLLSDTTKYETKVRHHTQNQSGSESGKGDAMPHQEGGKTQLLIDFCAPPTATDRRTASCDAQQPCLPCAHTHTG